MIFLPTTADTLFTLLSGAIKSTMSMGLCCLSSSFSSWYDNLALMLGQ